MCAHMGVRDQCQCLPLFVSVLLLREGPAVNLEFINLATLAKQRILRILISPAPWSGVTVTTSLGFYVGTNVPNSDPCAGQQTLNSQSHLCNLPFRNIPLPNSSHKIYSHFFLQTSPFMARTLGLPNWTLQCPQLKVSGGPYFRKWFEGEWEKHAQFLLLNDQHPLYRWNSVLCMVLMDENLQGSTLKYSYNYMWNWKYLYQPYKS